MSVRYYGAAPGPGQAPEPDKKTDAAKPEAASVSKKPVKKKRKSEFGAKTAVFIGISVIIGAAVLAGGFFCSKLLFSGAQDEPDEPVAPISDGYYYSGREVGGGDYFGEQTRLELNGDSLVVYGYKDSEWVKFLSGTIDKDGQYITDYRLKYGNVYTDPMVSYLIMENTEHHVIMVPSGDAASGRYAVFYSDLSAGGQDTDRHDVLFKDGTFQVLEERTALHSLIGLKKFAGKDSVGNDVVFQMLDETRARLRIMGAGFEGRDLSIIFDNGIRQEVESGDRVMQYGDGTESSSIESHGEFYSYTYDYSDGMLTITVYDSGDRNGRVYQLTE